MKEILCGSSCVKYILDKYNIDYKDLNINMNWISELAIYLKSKNINIAVKCYKSNLYDDYKKIKDLSFDGFKYIDELLKLGVSIKEEKLTKKELISEIENNEYIILCVESSKLNNDKTMNGGHYIVLNGIKDNKVNVINPIKDKYENRLEDLNDIINYCKDYGSWRILVKEK